MSQTFPCSSTCNHSTFDEKRWSRKHFFSEDLIRDQKTRTVFGFEKQNISVEEFTQKISLSLSFSLFLWFWAFRETQQCTCSHDKQSASLYIRQDSIDMSAFTHSGTCKLHSAVAIGISCTQSLGADCSPATPRGWCASCAEYTHAQ